MKKSLQNLKNDWFIATWYEKARFVVVIVCMLALGAIAIWQLSPLWDGSITITPEVRKVLFSYLSFIGIMLLSSIGLKPKGGNNGKD